HFAGEGWGHTFDLEIDGVVFHAPGATLGPAGVDHAVDEVDFDAVAGSEAAHVALAITVELADVLGEDDEVGGAETVKEGVGGDLGFALGGLWTRRFPGVGPVGVLAPHRN